MNEHPDERVRLRPLRAADAVDHARWRNDREVGFWATGCDPHFGPVASEVVARHLTEKLLPQDPMVAGVMAVELTDGRHIGMVDYRDIDWVVRSVTVGITIGEKDIWGHGYGTRRH